LCGEKSQILLSDQFHPSQENSIIKWNFEVKYISFFTTNCGFWEMRGSNPSQGTVFFKFKVQILKEALTDVLGIDNLNQYFMFTFLSMEHLSSCFFMEKSGWSWWANLLLFKRPCIYLKGLFLKHTSWLIVHLLLRSKC